MPTTLKGKTIGISAPGAVYGGGSGELAWAHGQCRAGENCWRGATICRTSSRDRGQAHRLLAVWRRAISRRPALGLKSLPSRTDHPSALSYAHCVGRGRHVGDASVRTISCAGWRRS